MSKSFVLGISILIFAGTVNCYSGEAVSIKPSSTDSSTLSRAKNNMIDEEWIHKICRRSTAEMKGQSNLPDCLEWQRQSLSEDRLTSHQECEATVKYEKDPIKFDDCAQKKIKTQGQIRAIAEEGCGGYSQFKKDAERFKSCRNQKMKRLQ